MIPHHGDTETQGKLLYEALTEQIIGAAIACTEPWGLVFWNLRTKSACAMSCNFVD